MAICKKVQRCIYKLNIDKLLLCDQFYHSSNLHRRLHFALFYSLTGTHLYSLFQYDHCKLIIDYITENYGEISLPTMVYRSMWWINDRDAIAAQPCIMTAVLVVGEPHRCNTISDTALFLCRLFHWKVWRLVEQGAYEISTTEPCVRTPCIFLALCVNTVLIMNLHWTLCIWPLVCSLKTVFPMKVSASCLRCVAAVVRTRMRSRHICQKGPRAWMKHVISMSSGIFLSSVQLVSHWHNWSDWNLTCRPWSHSAFGAILTSMPGFIVIVPVFVKFLSEPVCDRWQWMRWKIIYSLSGSLWLYQMNHQISVVP